jgi:hypothetical protein
MGKALQLEALFLDWINQQQQEREFRCCLKRTAASNHATLLEGNHVVAID